MNPLKHKHIIPILTLLACGALNASTSDRDFPYSEKNGKMHEKVTLILDKCSTDLSSFSASGIPQNAPEDVQTKMTNVQKVKFLLAKGSDLQSECKNAVDTLTPSQKKRVAKMSAVPYRRRKDGSTPPSPSTPPVGENHESN